MLEPVLGYKCEDAPTGAEASSGAVSPSSVVVLVVVVEVAAIVVPLELRHEGLVLSLATGRADTIHGTMHPLVGVADRRKRNALTIVPRLAPLTGASVLLPDHLAVFLQTLLAEVCVLGAERVGFDADPALRGTVGMVVADGARRQERPTAGQIEGKTADVCHRASPTERWLRRTTDSPFRAYRNRNVSVGHTLA